MKVTIYKCDFCRKELKEDMDESEYATMELPGVAIDRYSGKKKIYFKEVDICADCAQKIIPMLSQTEKEAKQD